MRKVIWAALAAAVSLAGCDRIQNSDAAFEGRVRAYLVAHPEVIEEAINTLNTRRQAEADRQLVLALDSNRRALERDPRDFVANPNGRVTLTQFYDYRCPHCINVAPQVAALIRSDPDVRVVFKELPIFGGPSDRAARLALEVHRRSGDSLAAYQQMMSARPLDDAAVNRVAAAFGVDVALLNTPSAETARHLADTQELARLLRIDGTPTFIVGGRVVPGEDMAAIRQAIAGERARNT